MLLSDPPIVKSQSPSLSKSATAAPLTLSVLSAMKLAEDKEPSSNIWTTSNLPLSWVWIKKSSVHRLPLLLFSVIKLGNDITPLRFDVPLFESVKFWLAISEINAVPKFHDIGEIVASGPRIGTSNVSLEFWFP